MTTLSATDLTYLRTLEALARETHTYGDPKRQKPEFMRIQGWFLGLSYHEQTGAFSASRVPGAPMTAAAEEWLTAARDALMPVGTPPLVPRGSLRADHWHWTLPPRTHA